MSMNKNNNLLKALTIVIGELPEKSRFEILEKLEEKGGTFREDFEILMMDLANNGEIKVDI